MQHLCAQHFGAEEEDHTFEGSQGYIVKPSQEKKKKGRGEAESMEEEETAPFILLQFCVTGLTGDNWLTLNGERTGQAHPSSQTFKLTWHSQCPINRAD